MNILVVDDQEAVRGFLARVAETCYPQAIIAKAESGKSAWQMIEAGEGPFDLVIAGLEMSPGMDGAELIAKVREIYPETRTILTSGSGEPKEHKAHAFIGQPQSLSDIKATIERVMAMS